MGRFPRLPPRLDRVFVAAPVYFITFCTYRRRPVLATPELHAALVAFSKRAYLEHHIAVGRYVILPDHIHLFVSGDRSFDPGRWIGLLKQALAKCALSLKRFGSGLAAVFESRVATPEKVTTKSGEYVQ